MKLKKKDTTKSADINAREVIWKAPDFLDNLEQPEGQRGEIGFVRLTAQEIKAIDLEIVLSPSEFVKKKPGSKTKVTPAEVSAFMQKRESILRDKLFEKAVKGVRVWTVESEDGTSVELKTWQDLSAHLLSMEAHATAALNLFDEVIGWIKGTIELEEEIAGE